MHIKIVVLFVIFVCVFEIYLASAQNETLSSIQNMLQNHKHNTSHLSQQEINPDVGHRISKNNEVIHKNVASNNTSQNRKKKLRKGKKKRKNNIRKNIVQDGVTEASLIESTTSFKMSLQVTKRRRLKKRRQRKKYNTNNILEVTTATPIKNKSLYLERNNTLFDSIQNAKVNTKIKALPTNVVPGYDNIKINPTAIPITIPKNRCAKNNGGCSQMCRPKGKIKCSCIKGYKLAKNRRKCVDINECQVKNGGCKEICRNTLGAYFCDCPQGFRLSEDLKSCHDINECHLRNGHGPCQDTCTNTYGSYTCDCSQLNGTRLGKDKHSCEDINECEEIDIGCSHLCINTRMGGFCSCPEGMELMTDYRTCQDVNECEDAFMKSSCTRRCINTVGSYYCEEDFQNDENMNKTKVPSCPPLDLPQHGFITCFRNNSLPYDTFTKNGRRIIKNSPGTECQLECPTGFKLLGEGRFVCGILGKWTVKKKGLCIKSPYPKLGCPPDQTVFLEKGHRTVLVHFPPPQTNVRWKIVKSYPKWAKLLKGKLSEGKHSIQFSVTDPASKLSSTCSFFVVVKK